MGINRVSPHRLHIRHCLRTISCLQSSLVGGAHAKIRRNGDFVKENNIPKAGLEPFQLGIWA